MRNWKWRIAALLALLPTVFGQLSPVSADTVRISKSSMPVVVGTAFPTVVFQTQASADGAPRVWGNQSTVLQLQPGTWGPSDNLPTYTYSWYRCATYVSAASSTLADGCVSIDGAAASTYQVISDDVGDYILGGVTATNSDGSATSYSSAMLQTVSAPVPVGSFGISTSNEYVAGNSITDAGLSWNASPSATVTYKWYSCTSVVATASASVPVGCALIAGATSRQYLLTNAQKGKFLVQGQFAGNSATGTSTVARYSASTATAIVAAPAYKVTVAGSNGTIKFTQSNTATLNTKLAVDLTGWVTAPTYLYKWYRCDQPVAASVSAPTGCVEIVGSTASSYVVSANDVGKYITGYVTARTGTTDLATVRIASTQPTLQVPVNTAPASVFGGVVAVGRTLSAVTGTWNASPSPTFNYQWYSCTVAVAASAAKNAKCSAIAGETSASYTVTSTMNNKFLVVLVGAVNDANVGAPVSNFSASTTKVLTGPANTVAPKTTSSILASNGQPVVGAVLTVTPGTWTGNPAPTKSYQWYSCDNALAGTISQAPTGCTAISGATGITLSITRDFQGKFLTVAETATNGAGAPSVFSVSPLAAQTKPVFDADPSVSGTNASGSTVTAVTGASSFGGASQSSYIWLKCSAPAAAGNSAANGCVPIANQTDSTLTLTTAMEGSYIAVQVTLTNVAGQTVRVSGTGSQVTGALVNTSILEPASSTGHVQLGVPVQANDGNWTGWPKPTFEYAWYRCSIDFADKSDTQPLGCDAISGANAKTYTPVIADAASYLSVMVTAVQGNSRVSVWSPASMQVFEAPSFASTPSVGNQHVVGGARLSTSIGPVRGTSIPTPTYAWYRCQNDVPNGSAQLATGCVLIAGATSASYDFTSADSGNYVLALITLTNETGTAKRYTAASDLVNSAPANLTVAAPVSQTQPPTVGVQLSIATGTWSGNPTALFSYQWYRCDTQQTAKTSDVPAGCVSIGGANSSDGTYTPVSADSGKYLGVAIRGYNNFGNDTVFTPTTVDISEAPRFNSGPILNPSRNKGYPLSLATLDVKGWPLPAVGYRWFRCDSQVASISDSVAAGCVVIAGATSGTYQIAQADVTKYLLLETKLTNRLGSVTKYTASTLQIRQLPEIAATAVITGNQWVGQSLTATGISVVGFPTPVVSLQWIRCAASVLLTCTVVGQNTNTYQLVDADKGASIKVRVLARNEAGASEAYTPPTDAIRMPPRLVGNSVPLITGTDNDGEARAASPLYANPGVWDGLPVPDPTNNYKYQWYRCDLPHPAISSIVPADCSAVNSAPEDSRLVRPKFTDAGKFFVFSVTVSNGTVDSFVVTASTARVYVVPTYSGSARTALTANQAASDGSPRVGYQIEASEGVWQGSPTPTYTYQWFACTSPVLLESKTLGDNCQIITDNGTSRVFNITSAQVNKYLGVMIHGQYKIYSDEIYTLTSPKSVVSPPVNLTLPRITSRYSYVQSTLKMSEGTWEGTPAPTQTHSWYVCENQVLAASANQPVGCSAIPNSSGNWRITADQKNKYIVSLTTSTNSAGTSQMFSASTDQILTGPVNLVPPVLSLGTTRYPSTLTDISIPLAGANDWVGDPVPTLNQYNWYRCVSAVASASDSLDPSCVLIETNASDRVYRPVAADVGKFLVASVSYVNSVGSSLVYTASTAVVNQPPNNTLAPSISGAAFVDRELSSSIGTWDGFPVPTYANQWMACASIQLTSSLTQPDGCVAIAAATSDKFKPTDDLLGKYLVLKVTATNIVGTQSVWSASTAAVVSGPVRKADPTFTYPAGKPSPIVGSPITTDGGVWKGSPTPTRFYEWFVCPAAMKGAETAPTVDQNCTLVPGETSQTITPTEDTRGKFLMLHVHAVNENGDADFYSATTTVIWMAPVRDHAVVPTGTAFNRLNVKAKQDTWKAFPEIGATDRAFAWYICTNWVATISDTLPAGCSAIANATAGSVKIVDAPAWDDQFLVVKIRATNSAGTREYYSASSDAIKNGPVNEKAPTVTGATLFQSGTSTTLAGNGGTWSPVSAVLSYQWYRCDKVLTAFDELDPSCSIIPLATSINYTLNEVDPGKSLVLAVTGTNGNLQSTTYSASTPLINEKVRNVTAPSVAGLPKVGETSTGVDGDWRGFPAITKKKTWYSCTANVPAFSLTKPSSCTLLSGAVSNSLINDTDLIGKYLVYSITGTNKIGTVSYTLQVFSPSSDAVVDPPRFDGKPSLNPPTGYGNEDLPQVGTDWTVTSRFGKVTPPTISYQWYRCVNGVDQAATAITALPDGCTVIDGATANKYTVTLDDRGLYLQVGVTGTNAAGAITQFTNPSNAPVAQAPVANPLPSVSGSYMSGGVLTADPGVWTPVDTALTYSWYSCINPVPNAIAVTATSTSNSLPAGCTSLSDSDSSYTVTEFEAGTYVTVVVSGTKGKSVTSYMAAATQGSNKAPTIKDVPKVSGDAFLTGMVLTVKSDVWTAMPAPTKSYQWYACDQQVAAASATLAAGCNQIVGATDMGYQMTNDVYQKYLLASVTATNIAGSATYFSATTDAPIDSGYEVGSQLISISASSYAITPDSPVTISFTPGTWNQAGSPVANPKLIHRWIYCQNPIPVVTAKFPNKCDFMFPERAQTVAAADSQPLTLDMETEFAGYYIASVEYLMKPETLINTDVKVNRQAVRISSSTTQVTIGPRLWTTALPTVYVEPTVGVGARVGVQESLTQVTQWQSTTDPYADNVLAHVTWRGVGTTDGTFSYRWFACDAKVTTLATSMPFGCNYVSSASASSAFTPSANETRKYVGVAITATNSAGSSTAFTKTSEKVTQAPTMVSGSEPALNTITFTQDTATVSTGTWQAEPAPYFNYKWMLCAPGTPTQVTTVSTPVGCATINVPVTANTITVPSLSGTNLQRQLVVQVTATNSPYFQSLTTASAIASATSPILKEKPYFNGTTAAVMTSSPTTSTFNANVGETITITNDQTKWSTTPSPDSGLTFTYAWYSCLLPYYKLMRDGQVPDDCTQISGQTGKSLLLTHDLAGKKILGLVTATSTSTDTYVGNVATTTTAPVGEKPYINTPPSISFGALTQPQVNLPVYGTVADFNGSPKPQTNSGSYKWYSCNTPVSAGPSLPSNAGCTEIPQPNPLTSIYPPASAAGTYLVFSSSGVNLVNQDNSPILRSESRYYSASVGPVLMAPEFRPSEPAISGILHVGQVLTTTMPTVTAFPAMPSDGEHFDWYSCPTPASLPTLSTFTTGCFKVGDTDSTNLTLTSSMAGRYIEIYATATNSVGTGRRNSIGSRYVTQSPTSKTAPVLGPTPVVSANAKQNFTKGEWDATPGISSYTYDWFLCTSPTLVASANPPTSCGAFPSQSSSTPQPIPLTTAMAGKYLILRETAKQASNNLPSGTNGATGTMFSASTPVITSPPKFDTDPTISGTRHVGQVLTLNTGTISGYPSPASSAPGSSVTIQWYSCNSSVTSAVSIASSGCSSISQATNSTLTIDASQADKFVTAGVTASNSTGTSITEYSLSGAVRVTQTPYLNSPVISIAGDNLVGTNKQITATRGQWLGAPAPQTALTWYLCDSAHSSSSTTVPSDCALILSGSGSAINSNPLPLVSDYRGKYILASETATNASNLSGAGQAIEVSSSIGPINMAPVFTANPSFTGNIHVGEVLTSASQTVVSSPLAVLSYEWSSCNTAVANVGSTIPSSNCSTLGVTNGDLTVTSSMAGKFIMLVWYASNDFGSVVKTSPATLDVTQSPVKVSAPSLSGDATVGAAPLVVTAGTWTGYPSPTSSDAAYTWYSCSAQHSVAPATLPNDCVLIANASASTISTTNAMAGQYLMSKVTVSIRSNKTGAGTATAFSNTSDAVKNLPQFGSGAPSVSGTAHVGSTLSGTFTSVTGNDLPVSTYSWWKCSATVAAGISDVSANCVQISAATSATLSLTSDLVGSRIVMVQTATNSVGAVSESSSTTNVVTASPTLSAAPLVTGTDIFATGASISVSKGTWAGTPSPTAGTYAYSWLSCTSDVDAANSAPSSNNCSAISGANAASLSLTAAMVGKFLVASVTVTTATNRSATDSATTYSAGFGPIRVLPSNTVAPTMSTTTVGTGRTITANVGTWAGTGPIATSYKWYSCPATVNVATAADAIPATCAEIPGFAGISLVVPSSLAGKKILLVVTGSNSVGQTLKTSVTSGVVTATTIAALALRANI